MMKATFMNQKVSTTILTLIYNVGKAGHSESAAIKISVREWKKSRYNASWN